MASASTSSTRASLRLLCGLLARKRRSPPVVFDAHTLLKTSCPACSRHRAGACCGLSGRAFDRHLPQRADHVIAVSEEIGQRL